MANILVSMYNFARDPKDYTAMAPFYEAFIEGLRKSGNNVFCFFHKKYDMDFSGIIPKSLLDAINNFDPDVAIFFDNNFWDITNLFDIPIVIYDVDSPLYIHNKEAIIKKSYRYKFITIQKKNVDLIRDIFHVSKHNVAYMEPFTEIYSDKNIDPSINISFVGANWLWGGASFAVDLNKHLSPDDRPIALENYFKFTKNPIIEHKESYSSTNNKLINNAKECSNRISGIRRARILSEVADLGLELRGLYWDHSSMNYYPELALCYDPTPIFSLLDNQNFYNRSRVSLCTHHIQAISGFSWRVCDIMASNSCLVSEYKPDIANLFSNIQIPMFDNAYDARRLCIKLLNDEKMRQDLVEMCNEEINRNFRFSHLLKKIECFLNIRLSYEHSGNIQFYTDQMLTGESIPFGLSAALAQTDISLEEVFPNAISQSATEYSSVENKDTEQPFRGDEFCYSLSSRKKAKMRCFMENPFELSSCKRRARRKEKLTAIRNEELTAVLASENPFLVHLGNYFLRKENIKSKSKLIFNKKKRNEIVNVGLQMLRERYKACARVEWYLENQEKNNEYVMALRETCVSKKIKVAFLVIFDSCFPAERVFNLMQDSTIFEPCIYIIPDVSRGEQNMFMQMIKSYKSLKEKYTSVKITYDIKNKDFFAIDHEFDIFCTANPYDNMTHNNYAVRHLVIDCKKLSFYINYGYPGVLFGREVFEKQAMSLMWKYFIESDVFIPEYQKYEIIYGLNTVVTGYPKMDALHECSVEKDRKQKRIIIAPHHTIGEEVSLQLSTFLDYADFFLKLPSRYPDVNFVFRPHPLLFTKLSTAQFWGKEKSDEYLEKMQSYSNVEYQNGGEYFDTFVNSDAIIHDCSSFLTEWMYTEKPGCYLLRDKKSVTEQFMPAGQKVLELYYHAYNEDDIISFIDDIVIGGNDKKQNDREEYVRKYVKVNYPNAAQKIVSHLEEAFCGGNNV